MTDSSDSTWHLTDGDPVLVRGSGRHQGTTSSDREPRAHTPDAEADPPVRTAMQSRRQASPFAAFLGIGVVLFVAAFFTLGVGNFSGDLMGSPSRSTEVRITTEGTFSPSTLTVRGGDTLTITVDNDNPQVLKPKANELFPLTVIFPDKPFIFSVPSNAAIGTYDYGSETLDAAQVLHIIVAASSSDALSSTQNNTSSVDSAIPLPFGATQTQTPSPSPQSSLDLPPSENNRNALSVTHENASSANDHHAPDTILTLSPTNGADQATGTPPPSVNRAQKIPTNTYTVGNASAKNVIRSTITTSGMHSAAPANAFPQRLSGIAETGPSMWLLALIGLSSIAYMHVRTKRSLR